MKEPVRNMATSIMYIECSLNVVAAIQSFNEKMLFYHLQINCAGSMGETSLLQILPPKIKKTAMVMVVLLAW